jgi:predicted lipoprotein with Yx(FWY)xxD motif
MGRSAVIFGMADAKRSTRWPAQVTLLASLALVLAACSNAATTHGAAQSPHRVNSAAPPTTSIPVIGGLPGSTTTIPSGSQGGAKPSIPAIAITSASPSSAGTTTTTSPLRTTPAPNPPGQTAAPTAAPPDSVVINAAPTDRGMVLTNSLGQTLYLLTADSPTRSNCTSLVCTTVWPPVLAAGGGTAGVGGVQQALLGSLHLPDGLVQVTYAGHPLYTYIGDNRVGETNGEGIKSFGGIWFALSAATGQAE